MVQSPKLTVNRQSYIPLNVQIRQQILQLIAKHSDRSRPVFSNDDDLAEVLGVARGTVRQAVRTLVDDGILVRLRGKGTYIAPPRVSYRLNKWGSWIHDWPAEGRDLVTQVLFLGERECPSWAVRRLALPEQSRIVFLRRLSLVDGNPVSLDDMCVVPEIGGCLEREELEKEPIISVSAIAERRLGFRFSGVAVEIEGTIARPTEADLLAVAAGAPLLLRWWTLLTDLNVPVLAGKGLQRADLFTYSVFIPWNAHDSLME